MVERIGCGVPQLASKTINSMIGTQASVPKMMLLVITRIFPSSVQNRAPRRLRRRVSGESVGLVVGAGRAARIDHGRPSAREKVVVLHVMVTARQLVHV